MKNIFILLFALLCIGIVMTAGERLDPPLLSAIIDGNYKQFQKLLDSGVDVNTKSISGITALMFAVKYEREDMVRTLIARKADVNAKTPQGCPVLIFAMKSTNFILRMLIDAGADVNADNGNSTPLLLAAVWNRPDRIDMLLRAGANVNFEDREGMSALFFAARKGHFICMEKLLQAKADSVSPFLKAVQCGDQEDLMADVLQNLMDFGVSANVQDKAGRSALMLAAQNRKNLCLKLLLKNKSSVDLQDDEGNTALHYAVKGGNAAGVKLLLEAKADTSLKNKKQQTALTIARKLNRQECLVLLAPFCP